MALGATHYNWHPGVRVRLLVAEQLFPEISVNTYVGHPWPGWDQWSADFWGPGGRGDPIALKTGHKIVGWLLDPARRHRVRHVIYLRKLWTPWSEWTTWNSNDHSGSLRHVHLTYWPIT